VPWSRSRAAPRPGQRPPARVPAASIASLNTCPPPQHLIIHEHLTSAARHLLTKLARSEAQASQAQREGRGRSKRPSRGRSKRAAAHFRTRVHALAPSTPIVLCTTWALCLAPLFLLLAAPCVSLDRQPAGGLWLFRPLSFGLSLPASHSPLQCRCRRRMAAIALADVAKLEKQATEKHSTSNRKTSNNPHSEGASPPLPLPHALPPSISHCRCLSLPLSLTHSLHAWAGGGTCPPPARRVLPSARPRLACKGARTCPPPAHASHAWPVRTEALGERR